MDSRPSSSRLINKKADVDVHRIHTRTHQILIVWITLHQSGLCHPRRLSLFSSFWLSQQQLFIIILNRMPWPDRHTCRHATLSIHTHFYRWDQESSLDVQKKLSASPAYSPLAYYTHRIVSLSALFSNCWPVRWWWWWCWWWWQMGVQIYYLYIWPGCGDDGFPKQSGVELSSNIF